MSTKSSRKLKDSLKDVLGAKVDKVPTYPASLGILLGGVRTVEVAGRPGFVYARLRNNESEIIECFNQNVLPIYDLPVLVTRKGTYYEIAGRDPLRYQEWGTSSSFIPPHAHTHQLPEYRPGSDPVWIYQRQFIPFLGSQTGSYGGGFIRTQPGYYITISGTVGYYAGQVIGGLLGYVPTGSFSRMILMTFSVTSGSAILRPGDYMPAEITGSNRMMEYLPGLQNDEFPMMILRIPSGTTSITNNMLHDARVFFSPGISATGTSGGGGGALNDLSDVTITSPNNNDVLTYSSGTWINQPASASGLNAGSLSSQEVVTGTVTVDATRMELNNESPANLQTLDGSPSDGDIIILQIGNATITVKHGVDNIFLTGAADFAMDSTRDTLMLMFASGPDEWYEIGRGDNS